MCNTEKYINPFTDFGFKKIFGDTEDTTLLESLIKVTKKVMYENLNMIYVEIPKAEQDKYHKNLKVYRDLINSVDTAFNEGVEEGMEKGIEQGKLEERIEIAKSLLDVLDVETISLKTGLLIEEIKRLKK